MANLPAYMLIRQYVIEKMLSHGNAEEPMMSERELCAFFQVSRTTVRSALRDLVADGYLIVRQGCGMFVNPAAKDHFIWNFKKVLLLVGNGKYTYLDGYYMRLVSGVFARLQSKPVRIQMVNLSAGCSPVKELSFYSPDGILWLHPPANMRKAVEACGRLCPVQLVAAPDEFKISNVAVDVRSGGRMAAEYFIRRGITHTFLVGGCLRYDGIRGSFTHGWVDAFRAAGIGDAAKRCIEFSESRLSEVKTRFLQDSPSGVFCFGSEFSLVESALTENQQNCPVLCDNTPFAACRSSRLPDDILDIAPDSLPVTAVDSLYRMLLEPERMEPSFRVPPVFLSSAVR